MGLLKSLAYLIPVRLGHARKPDLDTLSGRIISNRTDSSSGVVTIGDVVENSKSELWRFTKRIDENALLIRGKHDEYLGNIGKK